MSVKAFGKLICPQKMTDFMGERKEIFDFLQLDPELHYLNKVNTMVTKVFLALSRIFIVPSIGMIGIFI